MPATATRPFLNNRVTAPAVAGRIDPADTLYAVVMAYNKRQVGREYPDADNDALFAAVKAYNTRRLGA